jgi:hypothetical protein
MFRNVYWPTNISVVLFLVSFQTAQAEQISANDRFLTQFLLNSLGYSVGIVDGKLGRKSKRSIAKFLNENELGAVEPLPALVDYYNRKFGPFEKPLSHQKVSSTTELQQNFVYAGKAVTNGWAGKKFRLPPAMNRFDFWSSAHPKSKKNQQHFWGLHSGPVDINGDGFDDWVIVGNATVHASKFNSENCDPIKSCDYGASPIVYLNNGEGKWILEKGWFVDEREYPGGVMAMPPIFADFNGDGVVDMFVSGTFGDGSGAFRDDYYLSGIRQNNHLEASETHISAIQAHWSHGSAVGDIDNNGWDDVVVTRFWGDSKNNYNISCYFNVGFGFMRSDPDCSKNLTGSEYMSTSHTLSDVNADGFLDLVYSGSEEWNGGVGVALNDGFGVFLAGNDLFDDRMDYFDTMPNIFAYDLDQDGDQDIIGSVHRGAYNGAGVVIIENQDFGKSWKQKVIPLVTPDLNDPQYHRSVIEESGPWNLWMHNFYFQDVNTDGLIDFVMDGSIQSDDTPLSNNTNGMQAMIGSVEVNGRIYDRDPKVSFGLDQVRGAAFMQKSAMEFQHNEGVWKQLNSRKFGKW